VSHCESFVTVTDEGNIELTLSAGVPVVQVERVSDVPATRAAVRRWLQLPLARRPTAIFATCDIMAAGILQETHVCQLRVPDDLSLVGFDDTYASHLTPPLTTVQQPMAELGRTAVRLAMTSRANELASPLRERLTTRLIVRESTAPPA
jgi:DNA-binding LacI/PurR family transcriptional regulator